MTERDDLALTLWYAVQRVLALVALVAALPLLACLCIAVRIDSPGSALYSQVRPGLGGRPIRTRKLRTMVTGADRNASLARATAADAPEITRVGRVLRDLKLDELPQLWNVVCGEMALVGPRPIAPSLQDFLSQRIAGFDRRLSVRPGLTSLAQVCIYDNEDVERVVEDWTLRFEAERHYLRERSVSYDLLILLMTVAYLLRKLARRLRPAGRGLNASAAALLLAVFAGGCAQLPDDSFLPLGDAEARVIPFVADSELALDPALHAAALEVRDLRVEELESTAADRVYRVGNGDRLSINVFNEPGLERIEVAVDGEGDVQVPILERVAVADRSLTEIQALLKTEFARHFVDPWVIVQLVDPRSRPVYLLGEFREAGVHYMDRPTQLLQALAQGRGLTENAWIRGARLIRDEQVVAVDVHALLRGGRMSQNVWLQGGDTLYVPALSDQRVFILGAIERPGAQPLANHSMTLAEVVARAGGCASSVLCRRWRGSCWSSTSNGSCAVRSPTFPCCPATSSTYPSMASVAGTTSSRRSRRRSRPSARASIPS
jgi:lipopolysaccharide/colanic/teichoic acid biosynthesis glycosyltransferase/protein involved in polysaccharide export with SLBB domain